ncbi:hypothetical protein DFH27DRAFT_218815 [Peziza echinospora]|nr:hypothetical protein DFH27DRAFT_218815 [Peziza echinospora]
MLSSFLSYTAESISLDIQYDIKHSISGIQFFFSFFSSNGRMGLRVFLFFGFYRLFLSGQGSRPSAWTSTGTCQLILFLFLTFALPSFLFFFFKKNLDFAIGHMHAYRALPHFMISHIL